ncbi:MAG: glycogen debranching protein GlgX [Acidobacteriaceae bacterium]
MELSPQPLMNRQTAGKAYPLGATVLEGGINFSVFSSHAQAIELLLFEDEEADAANRVIRLTEENHRTGHYWHVFVPGLRHGQVYGYRVAGRFEPKRGLRFDAEKVLLDPYGKAICCSRYERQAACAEGSNESTSMRSVAIDLGRYDWEDDQPPAHLFRNTIIYEAHVGGFTKNPNSGVAEKLRGTYAGLKEKIPYLQDLGITAVELMPVFAFDRQDAPPGLENYWGYSPVSFFAPHRRYSSEASGSGSVDEFRDMVKALHRAGIEVILDVVYNHTAEHGGSGPTLSLKGLDNPMYYILCKDRGEYADFTGTGNTLNVNQSVVRRMIIDSLRHWVTEMHVDGFRFDLASVLTRDVDGTPMVNAPAIWEIDADPVLAGVKLIAEPWDAGGLYQVGSFSVDRWTEWNGIFRDDVRSFIKSDRGTVERLRERLLGSQDIYLHPCHSPRQNINFVTCHDGFTLNDLVSFNEKHNLANQEGNRDGMSENLSWNCGVEGATDDAAIEALRERQMRNALTLTMLAVGTPMLLMGDEVRRTQGGNNNAYCQDNETSWLDWSRRKKYAGLHRFVRTLIRLRRRFCCRIDGAEMSFQEMLESARIEWHGVKLHAPDLSEDSHTLAATGFWQDEPVFHLMMNAYWEPLWFAVPCPASGGPWFRLIDTSEPAPRDILEPPGAVFRGTAYLLGPRSTVLLSRSAGSSWKPR